MKQKIFIDSDVILDLLAKRESFYADASMIFTLAYNKKLEIYTTAVALENVFYILRKIKGNEETKRLLKNVRLLVKILPISENVIDIVLNSKFSDFEDGLQYYTAKENSIFAVITRNVKNYKEKNSGIVIQTSAEYLQMAGRRQEKKQRPATYKVASCRARTTL